MGRHAAGRHTAHRSRLLGRLRWGLTGLAMTAGTLALVSAPGDAVPVLASQGSPPAPVVLRGPAAPAATPPATAVQVSIPAIGVRSSLTGLGVDDAGALVPPADFAQAGWFAAGPVPGDVGPAVIAGHVDSRTGPAVFHRLAELTAGDTVLVTRSDGRDVEFRVTEVARYPKDQFATEEVYGPTTGAELRLITCGGSFDASRRSYEDNVVVYAHQV